MSEPARDRWLSIGMSVLLHGAIIGLLAYGWWHFEHHSPAPTLSIDATVVNPRTLKGIGVSAQVVHPPEHTAPPAPPTQGPPVPSPQELALRSQAEQAEARHQAAAEQQLLKQQQAEQARRQAVEAKAKAKAEAQKKARARKLAEQRRKREQAKKRAERRRLEAKRRAAERKAAARRAAEQRAARIAQLQQSLQQEVRSDAAARAGLASWQSEITARIQEAWLKPPTAKPGIDCVLNVTEVPGGAVTNVSVGRCNGDEAVRESIEAAVYRASPLPPPPDPSLFQRQLIIEFKPN